MPKEKLKSTKWIALVADYPTLSTTSLVEGTSCIISKRKKRNTGCKENSTRQTSNFSMLPQFWPWYEATISNLLGSSHQLATNQPNQTFVKPLSTSIHHFGCKIWDQIWDKYATKQPNQTFLKPLATSLHHLGCKIWDKYATNQPTHSDISKTIVNIAHFGCQIWDPILGLVCVKEMTNIKDPTNPDISKTIGNIAATGLTEFYLTESDLTEGVLDSWLPTQTFAKPVSTSIRLLLIQLITAVPFKKFSVLSFYEETMAM